MESSSRHASGGRPLRWISAVPLACRPTATPEPASSAAVRPITPRSTVDGTRTMRATQPSDSMPATICASASTTGSPDIVNQSLVASAGETPTQTSRGSAPGFDSPRATILRLAAGAPAAWRASRSARERCWRMAAISSRRAAGTS